MYYLSGVVFWLVLLVVLHVLRSRTGRALSALRDSDVAAESMGIHLGKVQNDGVCHLSRGDRLRRRTVCAQAGLHQPERFGIMVSVEFLMMIIIGGLGSLHGAVFGAMFFILLPRVIVGVEIFLPARIAELPVLESVSFGVMVILFVLSEPRGLDGSWVPPEDLPGAFPVLPAGRVRPRRDCRQRPDRALRLTP